MKVKTIKPPPYLEVSMECSHRRFYSVKEKIYDIALSLKEDEDYGLDLYNDVVNEKCDYEGDLELLIIYNVPKAKDFIKAIFSELKINENLLKEGKHIHITT